MASIPGNARSVASTHLPEIGIVHVRRVELDLPEQEVRRYEALLDDREIQRARDYYFSQDSHRFIVARGVLRELLGAYLDADPREIRFKYGSYGKPSLETLPALRFNLSHAQGMGLYAFTNSREIGVDIEPFHMEFDPLEIAYHWFSAEEVAALTMLSLSDRPAAFARCWTRKEALLKGWGTGIAGLQHARADAPPSGWLLHDLPAPNGFAAALAVEGISEVMIIAE